MSGEIWRGHYVYPGVSSELEHHGIKGQKWGEKNGPPYPLKQETHDRVTGQSSSGTEKKVSGLFKKKKTTKNEETEEVEQTPSTPTRAIKSLDELENRKTLTSSPLTAMSQANPEGLEATDAVRAKAVVAAELRARGYDVTVGDDHEDDEDLFDLDSLAVDWRGAKTVGEEWSIDSDYENDSETTALTRMLSKMTSECGPNSRGYVYISYPYDEDGLSNIVNFLIDSNGKLTCIDATTGKKVTPTVKPCDDGDQLFVLEYARMDNLELREQLLDYVK